MNLLYPDKHDMEADKTPSSSGWCNPTKVTSALSGGKIPSRIPTELAVSPTEPRCTNNAPS